MPLVHGDAFPCPRDVVEDVQQTLAMSFGEMHSQVLCVNVAT